MKETYGKILKHSWKSVQKAYKRILTDHSFSSMGYISIYDNYHILDKSYNECKFSIFSKENGTPFLFNSIYNFLSERNFTTTEEAFYKFISSLGDEHYLTYDEFFSLSAFINAACIYEVGRICILNENENSALKNLYPAISLLREKESWNFEKIVSTLSRTEKCFLKHEPSFYLMDTETKNRYRETFSAFCKNQKITEENAAEILKTYCEENNTSVGDMLFKEEKKASVLFTLLSSLFTLVTAYIGVNLIGIYGALLALPSIIVTSMSFADMSMSASEKPIPCPRLKLKTIPDEGKTALVISDLLINEEENKKIALNLERFYLLNKDENICFTVLADFLEGDEEKPTEREKEIMEHLFSEINNLNTLHGNRFTAFVRNRKYYKDENKYYGEERKRGAINALVNFITEGKAFDYSVGDTSKLSDVKFLFLLDSDTGIGFSTVKKMVSCALHPQNKPIIENGRVIKGYGVFQPSVKFQLVHEKETEFQSFITGSGGLDNYESASYDRFQSIFGSGIFCGKGLLNVELYKKIVIPSIPQNIVLSHDMPEGNYLRCRLVSDITTTDDSPTNAISYFSRLHRWIRGDFQNLFFLKGIKGNPFKMSSYSKFKILNNILRHITPISSLLLILLGVFFGNIAQLSISTIFGLLYIIFPFISVLIFAPFRAYSRKIAVGRRFYSEVTGVYAANALRFIYEIAVLPYNAYISLNASFKSLHRMIFTKKKLLEWKTFGISEMTSKAGILGYYFKFLINVVCGILVIPRSGMFILLGALWIITPLVLFLMSKAKKQKEGISKEEKIILSGYAKKIWQFFSENVDSRTNYLPPDNIQTAPTDAVAMRTSPTNIGFYMISCLAANDFGIIEKSEVEKRIDKTLSEIEKMDKWNGHLYNWYELKHLEVIGGRFVSTVDSGNFIAMLVCLKEGLKEKGIFSLNERIDRIIKETDFAPLYNKKKKLFTIGYNETSNKFEDNCYDLFMSEARITSYFAVANGIVEENHWKALGRTLITENGFLGMASWSGTMFEYFMSTLFLPLYKNSFSYEALSFAYWEQKKSSVNKLWGMSESGFYSFDSELNYQYKAHGIPSLSLKRYPKNEFVLSPYSSFLTLCIDSKGSINNLEKFKEQGVWGQYGFYESVDFTYGKGIVKSYMSHHMGMSIIAAANACFDNIFVKRFMNDKAMGAARDLLKERIPTNAPVFKNPASETVSSSLAGTLFDGVTTRPTLEDPKTALLSSGNLDMRVSDCGIVQLLYRGVPLNEAEFRIGQLNHSLAAGFIDTSGNLKYAVPLLTKEREACSFEYGKDYSSHIISGRDFAASVSYNLSERGDCFIIETKGNIKRKYSPFIVFEPQMVQDAEYYSGKSFACMKIKTEYDAKRESIFITSVNSNFVICVNCDQKTDSYLLGRDSLPLGTLFHTLQKGENIPSVYPLCYIKAAFVSGGSCRFYIGIGKNKEQSFSACEKEKKRGSTISKGLSNVDPVLLSKTASAVLFKRIKFSDNDYYPLREELWKKGISGDYPLFALYVKEFCIREITEYLKTYATAYRGHLKYDLIIFYDEEDLYFRKTEHKLMSLLYKAGCGSMKDKSHGIHLMNVSTSKPLFDSKDCFCFFKTISNHFETEEEKKTSIPFFIEKKNPSPCENYITIKNGGFSFNKGSLTERKPYSYLLSGKNFGSVVTDSSLGFTFSENSRLCKISHLDESPNAVNGEKIYALINGKIYDICASSDVFRCQNGVAMYEGNVEDVSFSLCVFVSAEKKEKYIIVSFSDDSISCALSFKPILGENAHDNNIIQCKKMTDKKECIFTFYNANAIYLKNTIGYCSALGTQNTIPFFLPHGEEINIFATGQKVLFRLGENDINEETKSVSFENALCEKESTEAFCQSFIPKFDIKTSSEKLDQLFPFLFYQTASSRFYSKTGYYQNGGAFGFRDQLQDCMSLIYSKPTEVRSHILNAAKHQYEEGDVMHWWHEIKGDHMGVRTTCSDDFLWLPLVCAKYICLTGDKAILKENVPYLTSPLLDKQNERYEKAVFSKKSESLFCHCIRSLMHGYSICKNNIPLMGCCDWNDGFSEMGSKGNGISLFSARLLVMATESLLNIWNDDFILKHGDLPTLSDKDVLAEKAKATEREIEEKFFINGQYVRCVSDNGTFFGIGQTDACSTDILCQAFAVLGGKNKLRAKEALLYAFDILYQKETSTLRLFTPPFDKTTEKGGYINHYPINVRENGGQYTHAAVWTAIALIKCGEGEMGLKLLSNINPLSRCNNVSKAQIYKNEPYVLSADIYTGEFGGRGGWSWYTGAASWYSVAIIEYVLGLKFSGSTKIDGVEKYIGAFKCLDVKPLIPYTAKISLGDYTVTVIAQKGVYGAKLDGKPTSLPIILPPKNSILEIFFE